MIFLTTILSLAFFAALWGLIRPYKGLTRGAFAGIAVAALVLVGLTAPKDASTAADAKPAATAKPEPIAKSDQPAIVAKTKGAASQAVAGGGYTRAEYADTYKELGSASFAKLNALEPGALYAVAESKNCDAVDDAGLSDHAKRDALLWYVDCKNGNRFIVSQAQAEAAMAKQKAGSLAFTDLAASCTGETLAMCQASDAQKKADESTIVAYCDTLLQKATISASGASEAWSWDYSFGKGDTIVVERDFSAKNAFGAKIKSRYHCEVNAATRQVTKLVVDGPLGSQRLV